MVRRATLVLLALAASPASIACAPSVSDLCDAACDCEDCTDREYDGCVRDGERLEQAAEEIGCEGELDAYVECADAKLECADAKVSTEACKVEEVALDDCLDEEEPTGGAA